MAKQILHLDIGNTVTSAKVWTHSEADFRFAGSSTAPSPGDSGKADLAAGAHIAYAGLKERLSRKGLTFNPDEILVTVSAAGEPRAVCAGVVKGISGESAKRAALSAGATVIDLITVDDGRHDYQRVSDLRRQAISMVVMAGGVDEDILGSGKHQLFNIAKIIAEGLPERRGGGKKVPLIYAASQEGREEVMRIFGDSTDIIWVDNVRSRLEEEHLESARNAVVSIFSDSVRLDPRFSGLGRLGASTVLPVGQATGTMVERMAQQMNENLMAISLDNDSVQVFSVIKGIFTRTVTPIDRIQSKDVLKWLPSAKLAHAVPETLANWKASPGVLPRTWDDLAVFIAFQKEAVRAAMAEHAKCAIELRGIHRQRQIGETFQVGVQGGDTLVKMERVNTIFLTGLLVGILSPSTLISVVMDAVSPIGVTKVYADRQGLMQSVGALPVSEPAFVTFASMQPIGVIVSPGANEERIGKEWAYLATGTDLAPLPVQHGEVFLVNLPSSGVEFELHPASKVDLGDGPGRKYRAAVSGFSAAYLDGRPRAAKASDYYQDNQRWYRQLGVFPPDVVSMWERGRD